LLEQVAKLSKVPAEAIKNFDEEAAIVNIQNNYESANSGSGTIRNNLNYHFCTFNPIEKIVELYEALVKVKKKWSCCEKCSIKNNPRQRKAYAQKTTLPYN